MTDLKKLMENAISELAEEEQDGKSSAIKEIIRIERNYYYSAKGSSGRLKEIREVLNKYVTQGASDAN